MSDLTPHDFALAGQARGDALGDILARAIANLPDLELPFADAARFELLGAIFVDIREQESALLSVGAAENDAELYRLSASVAVMHRLRLANLAASAAGAAN